VSSVSYSLYVLVRKNLECPRARWDNCKSVGKPLATHGPQGPGPRAANFQGQHIKKNEIEVWYGGKKGCPREKFKGDLY
jgi:hypothetical protein